VCVCVCVCVYALPAFCMTVTIIIQLTPGSIHMLRRVQLPLLSFAFFLLPTSIPFLLLVAYNFKYCAAAFLSGSIVSGFQMTCKNMRVIAVFASL